MVQIVRTVPELRRVVAMWRASGLKVAVVPTMGALHEGHLTLVRRALAEADRVIATIFVNPRQFNNPEDLARYPRTDAADRQKLDSVGTHLLYAPGPEEIYPPGFSTTVTVAGVSEGLCGTFRPGHFEGVATVVAKLLLQTAPDSALFGEKDFQQLKVIERLVRDLDIPVRIVPCPTVREADGLAMSSRNARLSAADRAVAPRLSAILFDLAARLPGLAAAEPLLAEGRARIVAAGYRDVEYLELRAAEDLAALSRADRPARLLVAAWLADVRLIDNVAVG